MLSIVLEGEEFFDEETNEFHTVGSLVLEFEHSLVSLSKWESEFQVPFLGSQEKTPEQILAYIRHMLLTPNISPDFVFRLSQKNLDAINEYIESSQSATTFGQMPRGQGPTEIITSELIYYWMVAFTIPPDYQHWHLNRLFSLIRICNNKNSPKKKMSRTEMATRYRELNAQRKAELGTKG